MLTRNRPKNKREIVRKRQRRAGDMKLDSTVLAARNSLKTKGWSYRRAAKPLGVHYSHLCLVLTGKRSSRRLLGKISALQAAR